MRERKRERERKNNVSSGNDQVIRSEKVREGGRNRETKRDREREEVIRK